MACETRGGILSGLESLRTLAAVLAHASFVRVSFADLPTYSDYVLVDGAFDPLHAGHIAYLNAARQLNLGPLLCAVASDDQIREKGREPLLPQDSRVAVMDALCDAVYAKDCPTEELILQLDPKAYVKGGDWAGRLPDAQLRICELRDVPIHFTDTPHESSTARLRAWALKDAERGLDRLEAFMVGQSPAAEPWQPVTDYSFEARKAIEGPHPRLIKDAFQPAFAFDVGCGPDEILCRLLRDIGVHAKGMDVQGKSDGQPWRGSILHMPASAEGMADLVICREVLEHLTVHDVCVAVTNLFRITSRFVYITTRFSEGSVFDAATDFDTDPTHITCLSQPFLRSLCVLNGGKRRRDLETKLDWQGKGRVLVYEVL